AGRDPNDETTVEREAGFVLVGPYENWEEFVGGEDIIEVVMSGDLEPRGDMTKLLEYSDAMQEMGETAGRLETRYLLRSGGQTVESPSSEE
ncbi:MAG: hypothetical protein SV760_02970, partial [Halobacteria archaeon]|nr:hypothetical protein [Halobacteria archaeon]